MPLYDFIAQNGQDMKQQGWERGEKDLQMTSSRDSNTETQLCYTLSDEHKVIWLDIEQFWHTVS